MPSRKESGIQWISFALAGAVTLSASGCLGLTDARESGAERLSGATPAAGISQRAITGGDTLAVGPSFTCALLDTGDVRCWGYGAPGVLGQGSTVDIGDDELPNTVGTVNIGGVVTQLALGEGQHVCALLDTGAVRCWGNAGHGQLGYGNTTRIGDDESPAAAGDVNVGGTVVQVAVGAHHTCALLDTGAVRCWGTGSDGRLGYGNTISIGDDETPASAGDVNLGGAAVQITAGLDHTCALLDTGAVRCWGRNNYGQLGYGHTSSIGDNETPASAGDVNVGGVVVQVDAGHQFTCALLAGGAVRCWGDSIDGRLGYGNTIRIGDDEVPASVSPVSLGASATQISTFTTSTCALLAGGAVRCWGNGYGGKLGLGTFVWSIGAYEHPSSVAPVNVGDTVVELALGGGGHMCAMLAGGGARCWGSNSRGELGYGNTVIIGDNEHPASVGTVPYE